MHVLHAFFYAFLVLWHGQAFAEQVYAYATQTLLEEQPPWPQ